MKRTPFFATITAASILFLLLPWVGPVAGVSEYVIRFLAIIFLWIGKTGCWNIVAGYTGYIDFGAVAYFGIGSYVTALLMTKADLPFLLSMLMSGLILRFDRPADRTADTPVERGLLWHCHARLCRGDEADCPGV